MSKTTGGPAFPVSTVSEEGHQDGPFTWQFPGMTLRDYFAAKALGGMLADPEVTGTLENVAKVAYNYADAMLAERNKGE